MKFHCWVHSHFIYGWYHFCHRVTPKVEGRSGVVYKVIYCFSVFFSLTHGIPQIFFIPFLRHNWSHVWKHGDCDPFRFSNVSRMCRQENVSPFFLWTCGHELIMTVTETWALSLKILIILFIKTFYLFIHFILFIYIFCRFWFWYSSVPREAQTLHGINALTHIAEKFCFGKKVSLLQVLLLVSLKLEWK